MSELTEKELVSFLGGRNLGGICDIDKDGNECNFQFFILNEGSDADGTAWEEEFRKMENISVWGASARSAIDDGLKRTGDILNN